MWVAPTYCTLSGSSGTRRDPLPCTVKRDLDRGGCAAWLAHPGFGCAIGRRFDTQVDGGEDVTDTLITVFDLEGNFYLDPPFQPVGGDAKFEGLEFV